MSEKPETSKQKKPDVVTHIVENTDATTNLADFAAKGFRTVAGGRAFRQYDWMTDTRAMNVAGKFQGMVSSARWKTVYSVVSKNGEKIGTIATVAAIAANVVHMAPEFEKVYNSTDNDKMKGLRYASLAGAVAQRTIAGTFAGGIHLIYQAMLGYCELGSLAEQGSAIHTAADVCEQVVRRADSYVDEVVDYVTDPGRQGRVAAHPSIVYRRVVKIFVD